MNKASTYERVNITLPKETLKLIDKLSQKRERSRFLNEAVRFYVEKKGKVNLKRLLKEGYVKSAKRDLEIAREWFHLEEEVWPKE